MAHLVVFGATGYAGGRIMDEALRRGDEVVAVARHVDALAERPGLTVRAGSVHDESLLSEVAAGADVLVVAVPARPQDDQPGLVDMIGPLGAIAGKAGVRLAFVGGAGSLALHEGGPLLIDTPGFPAEHRPEAAAHAAVLAALRELPATVDWFYVSPPAQFGVWAAGERTGRYRVGDDVLIQDGNGGSTIGGDDYALAFVDEIVSPQHFRTRFTVGN